MLFFILAACQTAPTSSPSGLETRDIRLVTDSGETIEITAEIANEPEAQAQGLMFREALPQGTGMLFIFPEARARSFWMKNTLIPLDILYFDAQGRLVSTATMVPCRADPCPTYPSEGPAQYALEVPVGFTAINGINQSWQLDLNQLKK